MKKAILIITTIISILLFDKVKAADYPFKYSYWYLSGCTNCIEKGSYTGKEFTNTTTNYIGNYSQLLEFTNQVDLRDRFTAGAREIIIGVNYANDEFGWYESETQGVSTNPTYIPNKSYTIQIAYSQNGTGINMYQFCHLIQDDETFKTIQCPLISGYLYLAGIKLIYNGPDANDNTYFFGYNRNMTIVYDKDASITNSINEQTQQQQQQFNQDHTYDNTPSQDINGTTELNDYSSQENQLMNSLDLNMSVMDGITINPTASAYIWDIATTLRNINPKIIILMTSILGLGIIKMILNR